MSNNGNSPASPVVGIANHIGLTKREAFALAAMQGMLARDSCRPSDASRDSEERHLRAIATLATRYADALLAQLDKPAA